MPHVAAEIAADVVQLNWRKPVTAPLRLVVHFHGGRDPRLVKGLLSEYFPSSDITDNTITLSYKTYDDVLRALRRVHDVCLDYGADMEVIEVNAA